MLSFKAALVCIAALVASARASSTPFHLAFPVHDLGLAKEFYGDVLGLSEGRSSKRWQVNYSLRATVHQQLVANCR
jgi:extradiol dioxygenase family protein